MKKPLFLLLFLSLFSSLNLAQTPGSLDLSFGNIGYVTKDVLNESNTSSFVFRQSDGKLIILGNSGNSFGFTSVVAIRFTDNGQTDNSFGVSGVFREANFGFGAASIFDYCELWSAALQPDGKVVMAGIVRTFNDGLYIFLIRLKENGMKDDTFGTNGLVKIPVINYAEPRNKPVKMALLPSGEIMLFTGISSTDKFTLMRLSANGALVDSFGVGGILNVASSLGPVFNMFAYNLFVLDDGKLLARGSAATPPNQVKGYTFRFLPDGTLDNTWGGGDGELQFSDDYGSFLVVLPDGKLLISRGGGLCRLQSNGSIDNTFGLNGVSNLGHNISAIISQQNGKFMCAGFKNSNGILLQLEANGNVDFSFGNTGGGYVTIPAVSSYTNLLQQPDGKIVACGRKDSNFLLGRHFSETISGVEESEWVQDFSVIPNPNRGTFNIRFQLRQSENLTISLFNSMGQLVKVVEPEALFPVGEFNRSIQVPGLSEGQYILQVQGQNGIKTYKIQVMGQ